MAIGDSLLVLVLLLLLGLRHLELLLEQVDHLLLAARVRIGRVGRHLRHQIVILFDVSISRGISGCVALRASHLLLALLHDAQL